MEESKELQGFYKIFRGRVNPIQRKYIPNLTDLLGFCRYKGRKHPQIQRLRMMEYLLLYKP